METDSEWPVPRRLNQTVRPMRAQPAGVVAVPGSVPAVDPTVLWATGTPSCSGVALAGASLARAGAATTSRPSTASESAMRRMAQEARS